MKTIIYYYTGTGNTLWSARLLAQELGETELLPLAKIRDKTVAPAAEAVGLAFPVHMWGVPGAVIDFVHRLQPDPSHYHFALAVNAGQVSATLLQLRKLLKKQGIELAAGFSLVLPSNYIPWGGPGPEAQMNRRFDRVRDDIGNRIAPRIRERQQCPVDEGPLWQKILFTALYKLSFPRVPVMDGAFWVDEKCNSCGICARVCPADNIAMDTGKPAWRHRCQQCLACIQWCPAEAIQYGKKTPAYPRYHHPAISLTDILEREGKTAGPGSAE